MHQSEPERGKRPDPGRIRHTDAFGAPNGEGRPSRITRYEWDEPEPSTAWRGASAALIGFAVGAAFFASTITEGSPISKSLLAWALCALLVCAAVGCLLADWDTNRGRKFRRRKVLDVPEE